MDLLIEIGPLRLNHLPESHQQCHCAVAFKETETAFKTESSVIQRETLFNKNTFTRKGFKCDEPTTIVFGLFVELELRSLTEWQLDTESINKLRTEVLLVKELELSKLGAVELKLSLVIRSIEAFQAEVNFQVESCRNLNETSRKIREFEVQRLKVESENGKVEKAIYVTLVKIESLKNSIRVLLADNRVLKSRAKENWSTANLSVVADVLGSTEAGKAVLIDRLVTLAKRSKMERLVQSELRRQLLKSQMALESMLAVEQSISEMKSAIEIQQFHVERAKIQSDKIKSLMSNVEWQSTLIRELEQRLLERYKSDVRKSELETETELSKTNLQNAFMELILTRIRECNEESEKRRFYSHYLKFLGRTDEQLLIDKRSVLEREVSLLQSIVNGESVDFSVVDNDLFGDEAKLMSEIREIEETALKL